MLVDQIDHAQLKPLLYSVPLPEDLGSVGVCTYPIGRVFWLQIPSLHVLDPWEGREQGTI